MPAHGELWWADLQESGARPVVILSRNAAIRGRRRALIAACSTIIRGLASEVLLEPGDDPVHKPCVVQLDAITDVSLHVLTRRLGRLSSGRMRDICAALATAVDCPPGLRN